MINCIMMFSSIANWFIDFALYQLNKDESLIYKKSLFRACNFLSMYRFVPVQ